MLERSFVILEAEPDRIFTRISYHSLRSFRMTRFHLYINTGLFIDCFIHLTGNETFPNQFIKTNFIFIKLLIVYCVLHIRWPYGFMGFLCHFDLVLKSRADPERIVV